MITVRTRTRLSSVSICQLHPVLLGLLPDRKIIDVQMFIFSAVSFQIQDFVKHFFAVLEVARIAVLDVSLSSYGRLHLL